MELSLARHIERTPGVRSGKPRIAGTRITVSDVVIWTEQGQSPEEIVTDFSHLTLAGVHAALAYYYDHREEIDQEIRDAEILADRMAAECKIEMPSDREVKDQDAGPDSVSSR